MPVTLSEQEIDCQHQEQMIVSVQQKKYMTTAEERTEERLKR